MKEKDEKLRVVHIPQVPMKGYVKEVKSLEEAKLLFDVLAEYDLFQFENRVKPDYANATFLQTYDETEGEWTDWYDEETGIGDIYEYFEYLEEEKKGNNPVE